MLDSFQQKNRPGVWSFEDEVNSLTASDCLATFSFNFPVPVVEKTLPSLPVCHGITL